MKPWLKESSANSSVLNWLCGGTPEVIIFQTVQLLEEWKDLVWWDKIHLVKGKFESREPTQYLCSFPRPVHLVRFTHLTGNPAWLVSFPSLFLPQIYLCFIFCILISSPSFSPHMSPQHCLAGYLPPFLNQFAFSHLFSFKLPTLLVNNKFVIINKKFFSICMSHALFFFYLYINVHVHKYWDTIKV